ncbi:hypothetical protein D083_2508 [Dickeya solani RNS 08.23.3.1.A]|nr:hypothetical protein D083_2508 [Dickeya solani RNS 08.23.3.1.A]
MFSPSLFVIDRRIMSKNETLFLLVASQTERQNSPDETISFVLLSLSRFYEIAVCIPRVFCV